MTPKRLNEPNERSRTSRIDSEVGEHYGCSVVTRRTDDRAGGVAAGTAGVQARHGEATGQSIGEPKAVVHVMDVPLGDAEVGLDLRRAQGEDIIDQRGSSGREPVEDLQEPANETVFFSLPGAFGKRVRHPLAEQRRAVPPSPNGPRP